MTQLTLSILLTYGSFEHRGTSAKAQKSKLSIKKNFWTPLHTNKYIWLVCSIFFAQLILF